MSSKKYALSVVEDEPIRPMFRAPEKAAEQCEPCQKQMIVVADYSQYMCPDCGNVIFLDLGGGDHPDRAA